MKVKLISLMCIILILCVGCGNSGSFSNKTPHIDGLIYSLHENSILVVEGIDSVDIPQSEWQGKPAYSIKISTKTKIETEDGISISAADLQKGDHVKVWHTGTIAESYPMQVEAVKIIVMNK